MVSVKYLQIQHAKIGKHGKPGPLSGLLWDLREKRDLSFNCIYPGYVVAYKIIAY